MRSAIALALAAGLMISAAEASAAGINVRIDEATPVSLGGAASHVVVGNPSIADVTIIDRRRLMVLGRSYGVTSITALDQNGRAIYSGTVAVGPGNDGRVSVFRGADTFNYVCAGRCERTPMPGERSDGVYTPYGTVVKDYADRAKAAGGGPGGGG